MQKSKSNKESTKTGAYSLLVRPDPIYSQWEIYCGYSNSFIFYSIFFILAGNKDMHKGWDEFEFLPCLPLTTELSALERLKIDI